VLLLGAGLLRALLQPRTARDGEIPFYSTATPETAAAAGDLVRAQGCRQCHSLWSTRDLMQAVPAPMLDGMGALRSEQWLYDYLSAPVPQAIPSTPASLSNVIVLFHPLGPRSHSSMNVSLTSNFKSMRTRP